MRVTREATTLLGIGLLVAVCLSVALYHLRTGQTDALDSLTDPRFQRAPVPDLLTGVVNRSAPVVDIDIDVAGARMLYLVVSDAGDGIGCDLANWGFPRFTTPTGEIRLIDLTWREAALSWGHVRIGRNAEGGLMHLAGNRISDGVGTHANSVIAFEVPVDATRFSCRAGLDGDSLEGDCEPSVRFAVYTRPPPFDFDEFVREPVDAGRSPVRSFSPDRFYSPTADPGVTTAAETLHIPSGFRAELLYQVPHAVQGSWVALAVDGTGRLIVSAETGGLYQIQVPALDRPSGVVEVEPLPIDLPGAQGLVCAFGGLYAVVNAEDESGLYRITDADGGDRFDTAELLRAIDGSGEHGPHGITVGPEGRYLYFVCGDAAYPDPPPESTFVPPQIGIDRLLDHVRSTDSHLESPIGGWICRMGPDGRVFELVACGFRNPYDLAFNRDGQLFTCDSDAEWDAGTPWYRPCRINHVISGADFGFRGGSSNWPDDYLDSFGSVVDLGFGSPAGIAFGDHSGFPHPYRESMFVADWSRGTILAVRLVASGGSYTGKVTPFVSGHPLPVTDLLINPQDGALYFITGGRGITSALYRLAYVGDPTAVESPSTDAGESQSTDDRSAGIRALRERLESYHAARVNQQGIILTAWPHLKHEDRSVRHAARIAIEHVPVVEWRDRAITESDARVRIAALVALIRSGGETDTGAIVEALATVPWDTNRPDERHDLLRAAMLRLARLPAPDPAERAVFLKQFDRLFPSTDARLNRDLAEVLAAVQAPGIVNRLWQELDRAPTLAEKLHFALCLLACETEWSNDDRSRYLEWLQQTDWDREGVALPSYIQRLLAEGRSRVPALDDHQSDLLDGGRHVDQAQAVDPVVQKWTVDQLLGSVAEPPDHPAAIEAGRDAFAEALCYRCHRVNGVGSLVGPDLTFVTRRYSRRELLEAIVEPDRVIPDQYRAVSIGLRDGRVLHGMLSDVSGDYLLLKTDPSDPGNFTMVSRGEIEEITPSPVSPMPAGLINRLTLEQIANLLAFLESAATESRVVSPDTDR